MHFKILLSMFLILRKHEKKNPPSSYGICCANIAEYFLSTFCVLDPVIIFGCTMSMRTDPVAELMKHILEDNRNQVITKKKRLMTN